MGVFKYISNNSEEIIKKALNDTAWSVKKRLEGEMKKVFDRPTPLTMKSIYIKQKDSGKDSIEIGIINEVSKGNSPAKYLRSSIFGGDRYEKRFEYWMRRAGILPKNLFIVPGPAAPLNQYGNIQGGEYTKILSWLKAHPDTYSRTTTKSKRTKKGKKEDYFLRGSKGHFLGLWKTRIATNRISPVILFVRKPRYKKIFDFYKIANEQSMKDLPLMYNKALRFFIYKAKESEKKGTS